VEVRNVTAFVVGVALVVYTIRAAIRLFLVSRTPEPEFMIRAGYLCLRHIAAFFWIPIPDDPVTTDPISTELSEFDGGGFIPPGAGLIICQRAATAWPRSEVYSRWEQVGPSRCATSMPSR